MPTPQTNRQAIKKGNSLRTKAARGNVTSKIAELRNSTDSTYHENPLLKLLKTSKKEKQATKSNDFTERIMAKSAGVSKSTRKRQRRKEKQQLKPNMSDLLASLPEETTRLVTEGERKFIKSKPVQNAPNPTKKSGHAKIMKTEHANFNTLLRDSLFRSSPFSVLKEVIASQQNPK